MKPALIIVSAIFLSKLAFGQNLYLTASGAYNFGSNRANFKNYLYNKWVSVVYSYEVDQYDYSLGKGAAIEEKTD